MAHIVQPCLDIHFKPADAVTTATVTALYEQLDHRLKAVKNWKACHAVICGILALRWADTFKVTRANLDTAHKEAFDAVADALTGQLLQRAGGKNQWRVHPHFASKTTVIDTRPADYRFRLVGDGVHFASQQSIQSPEAVSTINANHAAYVTLTDVGNLVEYHVKGLDLPPNHFDALEPLEPSPEAVEIANAYRAYITQVMSRFGYVGCLLQGVDENSFHFVVQDQYAHEFPDWLYQVSLPFWQTTKLWDGRGIKKVKFPAIIKRKDGRVQHLQGQSVQPILERMAGTQ